MTKFHIVNIAIVTSISIYLYKPEIQESYKGLPKPGS